MANLKDYAGLCYDLIDHDRPRDLMFQRMDDIFNVRWEPPVEMGLATWIKPVRSTEGHDALRGTTRILAARLPSITVWPTSTDLEDQARADAMERALTWFLNVAFQRGASHVLRDVVMSAARYDEVCGQVIYLPHQKKLLEGFGSGVSETSAAANRLKAMERSGPFSMVVRNPRSVHSLYSEYGVEAVVHVAMWPIKNLLAFYGEADGAKAIRASMAGKITPPQFYLVFDISDYSNRLIMAMPSEKATMTVPDIKSGWPKDTITILDKENELGFIPWICRKGGTGLESDSENSRIPMLFSVDHGNQYDIQNTMETLLFSETVQHAASPRWKKSGPGAENIQVGYGDALQSVVTEPGQDIAPLQPPLLDEGLMKLSEWVASKVRKSTIPPILQGGQEAQSRNLGALSMSIQSGLITVDPYKKLAEQWLSDACIQMLLWVKQGGEPIKAFDRKKDSLTGSKILNAYTISPDDINEKGMRIDVTLEAEIPVDKVQRINGATMLQRLGKSKRSSLEATGETDADAAMDESRSEAMEEFFLKRFFDKLNMKDQIEFQTALEQMRAGIQVQAQQATAQMQMQAQQQMQQQQMQMQQQAQFQLPGGGGPPQPGPEGSPMTPPGAAGPEVEGQGWNPAEGGTPPAEANPGETFEGQTGMTRGGTEIP